VAITSNENPPWGFVQWGLTGVGTMTFAALAFFWRLMLRLETFESTLARQKNEIETMRTGADAAMLRLAERFGQMTDDHFRLRETMGNLATRGDLRDLEDRLVERLDSLSTRLDRAIDE